MGQLTWGATHICMSRESGDIYAVLYSLAARKGASGILRNVVVAAAMPISVEPSRLKRTVHRRALTEGPRKEGKMRNG